MSTSMYKSMAQRMLDRAWQERQREANAHPGRGSGGFPEDFQEPVRSAPETPPEFHWHGVDGEVETPFPVRCLSGDPAEWM